MRMISSLLPEKTSPLAFTIAVISALLCNCSSNKEVHTRSFLHHGERNPSTAQLERRDWSAQVCEVQGIKIPDELQSMFSKADQDVKLRTKDEIVDRALALCYVGLKSERTDPRHLGFFDDKFRAEAKLTGGERKMMMARYAPTSLPLANWRYESLHVMLWALGYVDSLAFPSSACHAGNDVMKIVPLTEKEFRDRARMRSRKEILDQADLVMRLQWIINDSKLQKLDAPSGINEKVLEERCYAFNWLTRYMEKHWDQIVSEL